MVVKIPAASLGFPVRAHILRPTQNETVSLSGEKLVCFIRMIGPLGFWYLGELSPQGG